MEMTNAQREAIIKERLQLGKDNPTWSRTDDGFIHATKVGEDSVSLYIFAPNGNRYKETREFSNDGWEISGWDKDF